MSIGTDGFVHDVVPAGGDGTTGTTEVDAEEKADEPDKWQRVPNRQQMRDGYNLRGEIQPGRSRIRRKYHRIARQKGAWQ